MRDFQPSSPWLVITETVQWLMCREKAVHLLCACIQIGFERTMFAPVLPNGFIFAIVFLIPILHHCLQICLRNKQNLSRKWIWCVLADQTETLVLLLPLDPDKSFAPFKAVVLQNQGLKCVKLSYHCTWLLAWKWHCWFQLHFLTIKYLKLLMQLIDTHSDTVT